MLAKVKMALGIKNNARDTDITMNINACIVDLESAGIDVFSHLDDDAIVCAVVMWCRWMYDQNGKTDIWQRFYEKMKQQLSLDSNYRSDLDV